ncbi:MAG TPA: T9SS type A sorting domain-containing protein [Puia sp.]|nr:T9SS type A sorting domain-containing protein [Puia sp.]
MPSPPAFHGTGTTPGTYTGTTGEINPDDDKIVWNATDNRWEVTFDVTGFSGFYVSTGSLIPLPLTLTDFSGQTTTGGNLLKWTTASEQNTAWFEIQRHTPGSAFVTIAKIPAAGNSHLPIPTGDIDRLPAGTYLLSLMANGQRQTVKLVKY